DHETWTSQSSPREIADSRERFADALAGGLESAGVGGRATPQQGGIMWNTRSPPRGPSAARPPPNHTLCPEPLFNFSSSSFFCSGNRHCQRWDRRDARPTATPSSAISAAARPRLSSSQPHVLAATKQRDRPFQGARCG